MAGRQNYNRPPATGWERFDSGTLAQGYASDRPYLHPLVMERIRAFVGLEAKVPRALDVGCGAGLSSLALRALAQEVHGADPSTEMLAAALGKEEIAYHPYPAEELSFAEGYFDLVAVSGAWPWIERDRFLAQAGRILSPGGWLIIYDWSILGRMKGRPDFGEWWDDVFVPRFPKPPRNVQPLTPAQVRKHGFTPAGQEEFTQEVLFSQDRLVGFLLTESRLADPVRQGRETEPGLRNWLDASLAPFFETGPQAILFSGYIVLLRNTTGG